MQFQEIGKLSPEEVEKLGNKLITPRWWDDAEFRALTRQTWFSKMRKELNQGGRITFNLGFLKYEQGGTSEELSDAEVQQTVIGRGLDRRAADTRRGRGSPPAAPCFEGATGSARVGANPAYLFGSSSNVAALRSAARRFSANRWPFWVRVGEPVVLHRKTFEVLARVANHTPDFCAA